MGASREYGQFRRRRSDYAGKSEGKAAGIAMPQRCEPAPPRMITG